MLDANTFQDNNIIQFLNHNFVNLKINAETEYGQKLFDNYSGSAYPMILFLDINKNESDFYTLYTNKFENTIFMYLSEDDVTKLNDISLNYNIRCAYKERVGFIAGIGGQSWKKINKNQRIQNDLCSDLF